MSKIAIVKNIVKKGTQAIVNHQKKERLEEFLNEHDGLEMDWEINTPIQVIGSVFNFVTEILE